MVSALYFLGFSAPLLQIGGSTTSKMGPYRGSPPNWGTIQLDLELIHIPSVIEKNADKVDLSPPQVLFGSQHTATIAKMGSIAVEKEVPKAVYGFIGELVSRR